MKLDAHPLVVAVALGLLGPVALEGEEDEASAAANCGRCDADDGEPDTEEIARVEEEWAHLPR
jgi:hypothetical protein